MTGNEADHSIISCANHDKSVAAREYLVRHDAWVRCSVAGRFTTGDEIVGSDVSKSRNLQRVLISRFMSLSAGTDLRFKQVDIHPAASSSLRP